VHDSIHAKRLARLPRAPRLAVALLVTGVLAAGCAGSSHGPTAATVSGATRSASGAGPGTASGSSPATGGDVTSSRQTAPDAGIPKALAYANCMRANGVPNFPDPTADGNFLLHPGPGGIDPSSPALSAANMKCQKLYPLAGFPAPGTATHPTAQTLARVLKVSQCMRNHGISGFPDPRTSVPSDASPAGYGEIVDENGAILAIPSSLNTPQTGPAYWQAAAACGIGGQHH
jgi:hypothetical protein